MTTLGEHRTNPRRNGDRAPLLQEKGGGRGGADGCFARTLPPLLFELWRMRRRASAVARLWRTRRTLETCISAKRTRIANAKLRADVSGRQDVRMRRWIFQFGFVWREMGARQRPLPRMMMIRHGEPRSVPAVTSSAGDSFGEAGHFLSSRRADVWQVAGRRLEFAFHGEGNGLNCGCPDTAAEGERQHENDLRSV